MLLRIKLFKKIPGTRGLSTIAQPYKAENEYSEKAEYPPIMDDSYYQRKGRKSLEEHEQIKRIGTIEEKLLQINMPRYYGFKCLMLDDKRYPYNTLPFFQYVTNTEFVEQSHVPKEGEARGEEEAKKLENFLGLVKADIQDALEFEIEGYKKFFDLKSSELSETEMQRVKTSGIVKQLNRVLVNTLGADNHHLYEMDSDVDPRHEAFWFVGGLVPPMKVKKAREALKGTKKYANDSVIRPFQYVGQPFLTLRHIHPLKPFEEIDFDSVSTANEKIPKITCDPLALGFNTDHRHGTSIPGFWPGNVREYGLISFQDRGHMLTRKNEIYGEEDKQAALHSQAILSSFAWLFSQACYQGFSTFNDMNYPLTTQTVLTDGQLWSFYKYQLNTTVTHTSPLEPNFRYNKCWGTKEMKLYEKLENGKLQGLNDDVLKNLITFYMNQPTPREHEMRPLLAKEKKIADLENVKQRDWLEKTFKYIMSNRPRHRLVPEIYTWEKIYKIDFNTRPMDRRLRFFELGINPFARRLNEHQPKYIPRHLRARGIYDKKKWEPTYWPLDHRANDPYERSHSMYGAPRDKKACLMDRKRKSYK